MEPFYRDRIVYQIYPRSFRDSNGDGFGDLNGIREKLLYLHALGVGLLWLSPIYPSPDRDNGYDIADYTAIDPRYGTMAEFDALLSEAKALDIGIVMDLVINHTSDRHSWFQKSMAGEAPYRDYYIWRDKPNNWGNFFGGSCWTWNETRKQYYLHLFDAGQPDLNYRNPAVVQEVEKVMSFWLDKGVAGFRCDVINILWKSELKNGFPKLALTGSGYYLSQPGCHALLRRFREDVWSHYDCFTVGETVMVKPKDARLLCDAQQGGLDMVFSFEHMNADCFFIKWLPRRFRAKRLFRALDKWQRALDWNANYLENHDQPRSVSRFGSPSYPYESATALATMLLCLRGTPFLFEGQELGMTNFDYASMDDVQDVESRNMFQFMKKLGFGEQRRWRHVQHASRDNARTPMQWDDSPNGGFTAGTPWLKCNQNYKAINVAAEERDPHSVLAFYRRLCALRNGDETLKAGAYRSVCITRSVYAFTRSFKGETRLIAVNLSDKPHAFQMTGTRLLSNYPDAAEALRPYEAVVMRV